MRVLLADLCYERRSPSPLPVPYAIANIAAAVTAQIPDAAITIVRTIPQYYAAIESQAFDIAGFSHYVWNAQLGRHAATHLKTRQPDCLTVFGGPQLPIHPTQQEAYVRAMTCADVFIEKEGERAFVDFVLDTTPVLPSTRYMRAGNFIAAPLVQRILDLDTIPSPYLNGSLDAFLEQGFTPMVENNRGCPFACDFCGEGDAYHTRIGRKSLARLKAEYLYVAERMTTLRHLQHWDTVYFTDSNTGMYPQDVELCTYLRDLQAVYGWPARILTSTGKNQQARILSCVELLNGALVMTASVQSTSPIVLKHVWRQNVSTDVLITAARGNGVGHRSYSEIILALPGDSYQRHLDTIRDMVNCHVHELAIVQLMILPDTPMADPAYQARFGLQTKWRLLTKGFAAVPVGAERRVSVEHEQIGVGTAEMPFSDYLRARVADLLVAVFYNGVCSAETFTAIAAQDVPLFTYVQGVIDAPKPPRLQRVLDDFLAYVGTDELFDSEDAVTQFVATLQTTEQLEAGAIGRNATYYYGRQARAFVDDLIAVAKIAAEPFGEELSARLVYDLATHLTPASLQPA